MQLKDHFQKYNLTPDQSFLLVELEQFLDSSNTQSNVFLLKRYAGTWQTCNDKLVSEVYTTH